MIKHYCKIISCAIVRARYLSSSPTVVMNFNTGTRSSQVGHRKNNFAQKNSVNILVNIMSYYLIVQIRKIGR